jgi:predicted DNA-binding protein with PD1-like motif
MLAGKVEKVHFARFDENEDLLESIRKAADRKGVKAGAFSVIGAVKKAVIGFYSDKKYITIELKRHLEIASCSGNIAVGPENETIVHAHIVVSDEKGQAFGGHLFQGTLVGPTAELVLFEVKGINMKRVFDEKSNLKLLELG